MKFIFPIAVLANTFAMTALFIALGLSGKSALAADVAIVHGATLALFFAFSANARSLILSPSSSSSFASLLLIRLILIIPLFVVAYFLSVSVEVSTALAIALISRRAVEWLGELHLSEWEKNAQTQPALFYVLLQSILLAFAFAWLIKDGTYPLLGIWLWAFVPLIFSIKIIIKSFKGVGESLKKTHKKLMPHYGSTLIIGVTVYVFRLLLILLTGKEIAGDLFTAFAIGGLIGSVFANAFGASMRFHEQQQGKHHFPILLSVVLSVTTIFGVSLLIASQMELAILEVVGKTNFFWQAVGLSLIGGVVMVFAQRIRFKLLQNDVEHDVFGPDVMSNLLLLAVIPFSFYLVGLQSMTILYLLSAVLAYAFYFSYMKHELAGKTQYLAEKLKPILLIGLLFPLFFQINKGVFNVPGIYFNSMGNLGLLPIPISVFACFGGIFLLGKYKQANAAFGIVFCTFILMLLPVLLMTTITESQQEAKLILLVQFLLPMFALVFGSMFQFKNNQTITQMGKVFLYVLMFIVPLQLFMSWYQGMPYLTPSIGGLFSIYQHFQYVPVIFVSAFLISLFGLWSSPFKSVLILLAVLMAIYVAASLSMLAIGLLIMGVALLACYKWHFSKEKIPFILLLVVTLLSFGYIHEKRETIAFKFSIAVTESASAPAALAVPQNVTERIDYWKFYTAEILDDLSGLMLGHQQPPDRDQYPSAHNYYLDFTYNFGLVALIPIIALLIFTLIKTYSFRKIIYRSPELLGLCFVVLFLLFADNFLKVGLRQPYPGIFTFFLWGLLLNYLHFCKMDNKKS